MYFSLQNPRTQLAIGISGDICADKMALEMQEIVPGSAKQQFIYIESDQKIRSLQCPDLHVVVPDGDCDSSKGIHLSSGTGGDDGSKWLLKDDAIQSVLCEDKFITIFASSTGKTRRSQSQHQSSRVHLMSKDATQAQYDSGWKAPRCIEESSTCDTGSLVKRRGSAMTQGGEPNQPNTIDGCQDGNASNDEYVDQVIVRSGDVGESSDGPITSGQKITITAKIWAWSVTSDFVDFFYKSDRSSDWKHIGTVNPSVKHFGEVEMPYTVPSDGSSDHAVRVQIRYVSGISGTIQHCKSGDVSTCS